MKIQFGQITIEGVNEGELSLALSFLEKLQGITQPHAPANERKSTALAFEKQSKGILAEYTPEQVESAKLAIAKGYSFETSYKAISGKNMKITHDEKERFGFDREGIAKERLESIANSQAGEAMQGEQVAETKEDIEDDDL